MLFSNITVRLLASDDFPPQARAQAVRDLTNAAALGAFPVRIGARYPLDQIAAAHIAVETGSVAGRVLVALG